MIWFSLTAVRPEATRQPPAEKEGEERGERGTEDDGEVVRGKRPGGERDRREQKCGARHNRGERDVKPVRDVDQVARERVQPVRDRVRKPLEPPDRNARIGAEAHAPVTAVQKWLAE
jgi:hypothetical protein